MVRIPSRARRPSLQPPEHGEANRSQPHELELRKLRKGRLSSANEPSDPRDRRDRRDGDWLCWHERNERAGTAGVTGAGAVATGVLLISSRSGCSGNSEDPDACTFGDHGRDLAVTVGGGLVLASGAVLLGARIYLLSR